MKLLIPLLTLFLTSCSAVLAPQPEPKPALVFEGQFIIEEATGAAWCGDSDDCIEEVGGITYAVTGLGDFAVVIKEGAQNVVPYDESQDLCKTEFKDKVCSPNYVVSIDDTIPNDPQFSSQWGLESIRAHKAWDIKKSNEVKVAIIDTGVDCSHPDLNCVGEYNAITKTTSQMDDNGHGTHCAGVVGALTNNRTGISGISWGARLLAVKFLGANGSGSLANGIDAINWAVDNGADIISASWGCTGCNSVPLRMAIERAGNRGVLFVAAAGNSNVNNDTTPHFPSSYNLPNIVSVAAIGEDEKRAPFSNYGKTSVDLAAPGVSILSTYTGGSYKELSGTSMATPHVSGAAALVFNGSSGSAKDTILQTVRPKDGLRNSTKTGGVLDLYAALQGEPTPEPPATCEKSKWRKCKKILPRKVSEFRL
jgi:subtilisin family serine protease